MPGGSCMGTLVMMAASPGGMLSIGSENRPCPCTPDAAAL